MTNATIKHGELTLRKVSRKPKNGDFVVFNLSHFGITVGEPYEITNGRYEDSDGDSMNVYGWDNTEPEPDIYEVYEAPTFKVGDKVRVLVAANGRYDDLFDGAEGVIEEVDTEFYEEPYRVSCEEAADYDRFKAEDIELISVELKKGDHVKILALSKFGLNHIGKTGVIDILNFKDGYSAVTPLGGGKQGLYLPEQLELIEPKTEEEIEMTKTFEIGDKVKVLNARNGRFGDQVDGAIGVIDDVRGEGSERTYRVVIEGDFDRYDAKDIELYTVQSTKAARPLQVGDKVRMISTNPQHGFGAVSTGDVGVVSSVHESSVTVNFPKQSYWNGYVGEFELVESESSEVVTYEVGDWVRILDKSKIAGNIDIVDGGVYEVIRGGDFIIIRDGGRHGNDELSITPREQSFIKKVDAPAKTTKKVGTDASHNFEEGDTIRILNKSGIDGASVTTNGKTYEITDVDWEGDITIVDDGGERLCILRSEFEFIELVEKDEFEQFQPGDKVVLLSDGGVSPLWGFEDGGVYEVEVNDFTSSFRGRLISLKKEDRTCATGYALPSQLRKVEEVEAPIEATPESRVGFTVGDEVVVVKSTQFSLHRYEVGETAKVTGFNHNDYVWIEDAAGKREHMHPTQIKPIAKTVSTKPTSKFNVGDRVAFIEERGLFGGYSLPEESRAGTVLEVIEMPRRFVYFVNIDNYGANLNFTEDEVMEEVIATKPELKEGDFIEIDFDFADPSFSYADITKGKAYQVVNGHRGLFFVDDIGDTRHAHIKEGAFKIVEAPPKPARKLQVGDIVRVGESSSVNPTGSIGEITELNGFGARVNAGFGESSNFTTLTALELIVAKENREDKNK